jgi:DNA polymerase I-like protein with 3'-5' exonuclease and polymerase domains
MIRFRFDESDYKSIASAKRVGMNFPIQGTSADILKRALRILHDNLQGTSGKLVNIVHDEILVESNENEAEKVSQILEKAMISAAEQFVTKVPIKVDVKISDAWEK